MNAKNLSDRLKTVASFVEQDTILADIGSDHAYLPCYLVHQSIISKAIAGEVVKGPFESAVKQVKSEGLEKQIEVRFGDGLQVIEDEDQVGTVTIAGMGGPLIASILEAGKHKLTNVHTLILQPNIHAKAIREWAIKEGWNVDQETILEEHTKIYEVIVLKKGNMVLNEQELLLGPILMQSRTSVFQKKWSVEMKEWERILTQLKNIPPTPEVLQKVEEIENKISLVKELL
ncbi:MULTISPECIES: tRNA (adenine(22)-N(1))-methyltransferase TrmK [unclassified Psychrobacillus]|uniref:tRNA (adenine(22)-N(1))-methyltransferase n=1 Tax=unclassified Psychrobacillus TaxID=2636677 RepID=UPI00146C45A1|nr:MULTISPECIES: tRNA (adenine(22)-N(1))-methyltransferase TrmK [unclassified Psychrobacillus]MCM3358391.1 tRNA (adenine(22)-N(1))-methyltransferase TrmK [Psychrobacillus sp. MER TA 171]NME04313.1 tRNA (adenine-N(1))-methyltransferase [Psychrobacillus sp. BL-248-WT-3]